jgi:hypothetical protein
MTESVLAGEITNEGVILLLAEIEERRTSGVLHFEAGDIAGDIELVAGQLALEQPELSDGRDPVEVLLSLREGSYELFQKLPALPVSKGDDQARAGSLDVHVPADLMNYCESAGLTGKLRLEQDGKSAEAIYDRGELKAIRVDGTEDDDLHEVFGWSEGQFTITAFTIAPKLDVDELDDVEEEEEEEDPLEREPTIKFTRRRKQDTSEIFLRSVEVALTDILSEREKRRGPDKRTSPPAAMRKVRESSIPGVEKVVRIHATKKRKRQPTVRIVYASNREPGEALGTTRHVGKGGSEERVDVLPEASPDRVPAVEAAKRPAGGSKKKKDGGTPKKKKKDGGTPKKKKVRKKEGAQAMKVIPDASEEGAGSGDDESGRKDRTPRPTPKSALETLGWVAAVFLLLVLSLFILARLPALG